MREYQFCGGIVKADGGYIVQRPGTGGFETHPHVFVSLIDALSAVARDSGELSIGEDLKSFIERHDRGE